MSDHEYVPSSKFGKWFNDRLPLLSLASHLTDYPTPKNLNYWWTFGGILTFCLITQIVTGLTELTSTSVLAKALTDASGFIWSTSGQTTAPTPTAPTA